MTTAVDELLLSAAEVEIQATGKPPAVTIVAYTGGLMSVPGWGPVAIDLAGIDASAEQVGILADHNSSLAGIDDLATRTTVDLKDRQMVEAFVDRIEINPEAKTGVVYLMADLEGALLRSSTRLPIGDYMGAFEICFYGWKEGAGHSFFGPNNATDLWHVKKVNPQSMIHLTEKPVELAVRAMNYSSRSGEHVLDLFGGSGSTLIGAQQTGRKAFLMELDTLYCDVIVQRFEKFSGVHAERLPASTGTAT